MAESLRIRLRRRLFAGVSVLSLILCLATVGLWVRSYSHGDQVGWYINEWNAGEGKFRTIGFECDSGGMLLFLQRREAHLDLQNGPDASFREMNPPLSEPSWIVHDPYGYPYMLHYAGTGALGFGYFGGASTQPSPMVQRDRFLVIPSWFATVLFALAPPWWVVGPWRRQSKRRKLGLCLNCGYDLRASPERCPECRRAAAMRNAEARPIA